MAIRKFRVNFECEIELCVDDSVIDQANSNEWRKMFYGDLTTPYKIAEHIAYNVVLFNRKLSSVDGFANLPDEAISFNEPDWNIEAIEE